MARFPVHLDGGLVMELLRMFVEENTDFETYPWRDLLGSLPIEQMKFPRCGAPRPSQPWEPTSS